MASAPLEYAAAPQRLFRVRFRWVALILLLGVGAVWWRYGGQLREQAKLRWAVHQCVSYSRGEDSVALEANRYYANDLTARDSGYRVNFPQSIATYGQFRGGYKPVDAWDGLGLRNQTAQLTPPNIRSMLFTMPGGGLSSSGPNGQVIRPQPRAAPVAFVAPLFVHERTSKGRPARLVVIELSNSWQRGAIDYYVIVPGPLWGRPAVIWQGQAHELGETIPGMLSRAGSPINADEPPARVYFGQVDPNDSAKFTFRVSVFNAEFRFEGRLLANDTIEIEGPLLSEVLSKISATNAGKLDLMKP